jgi:hypothetical protein
VRFVDPENTTCHCPEVEIGMNVVPPAPSNLAVPLLTIDLNKIRYVFEAVNRDGLDIVAAAPVEAIVATPPLIDTSPDVDHHVALSKPPFVTNSGPNKYDLPRFASRYLMIFASYLLSAAITIRP